MLIILPNRVPIHDVPPSLDIIGPPVLVIEIIGMLPNVHTK